MVFGKQGELLKTTIGILGPVDAAAQIGVFWRGEVVISPTEGGATLLEAIAMRRCSDLKPGREIRDFDPKALVPVAKRTPESAKAPKALPKPTAIPDPNAEEPMPED